MKFLRNILQKFLTVCAILVPAFFIDAIKVLDLGQIQQISTSIVIQEINRHLLVLRCEHMNMRMPLVIPRGSLTNRKIEAQFAFNKWIL